MHSFGGGQTDGLAKVVGKTPERRLSFDFFPHAQNR
jgi:hypothetical protein